jgi:hypothetical protein
MPVEEWYVAYCPLPCDKPFVSSSPEIALELVIAHVALNHPEYDPNWHREEEQTL